MSARRNPEMRKKLVIFAIGLVFVGLGLFILWRLGRKQVALFDFLED
jgi:hypothetical protein